MSKNLLSLLFVLCSLCSVSAKSAWGAWGEGADGIDIIRLTGYDRFYDVLIGVDMLLPAAGNHELAQRFSQAKIKYDSKRTYELSERYRVFYLWKNNFVVRFVVSGDSVIAKKEAREKRIVNLFDAKPFKMQYDCQCLQNEALISQNNYNPDYFTPDYFHTKLGIERGDSLLLCDYFQMQILQADTTKYSADCPPVFHIINPYLLPYSYRNIREEWTADDVIHNYFFNRLFVNNKILVKEDDNAAWQGTDGVTMCYLIPATIPEIPQTDTLFYKNCLKDGSNVTVSYFKDVSDKPMYRINNTFPYIDRRNVSVSYNILYIPEVMYLSEPLFKISKIRIRRITE